MKRPIAVVGFTYLFTAAAAVFFSWRVCLAVGAVLGLFGLLAACSRHAARRTAAVVLVTAGIACAAVVFFTIWRVEPQRALAGETLLIAGTVNKINGERSIELTLDDGGNIAVSSREALDTDLGERFTATVALSLYNEGDSSPYAERKAKNTPLRGFVLGEYTSEPPPAGSPRAVLNSLKQTMSNNLRRRLPRYQGDVLAGMLLGQRHLVPREVSDSFSAAGISHILAISGFHLAVIAGFFRLLFRWLRCGPRLAAAFTAACVFLYMALVGFSPSVTRAGTMVILALLGQILSREADSLTSLAVAGLLLCANPLAVSDVSLQLSFLATLGIVLGAKPLAEAIGARLGTARRPKAREAVISGLSLTLCATAFTLPVVATSFEQVAIYAPLTNLLLVPLAPLALITGFAAAVLGAIPFAGFLAAPFAFVAGMTVSLMTGVAELVARLPFASLPAGAGFVPIWMAGAAVLAGLALVRPTRKKAAVCAALCAITLFLGVGSYQLVMRGAVRVTVLATQNAVVQVAVKDGHAVVAGDINSKSDVYAVRAVLNRYDISGIDLFLLSPTDKRRSGAVSELFGEYRVGTAVLSRDDLADERMELAVRQANAVYEWGAMETLLMGGDRVSIAADTICLEFGDIKTFLLTGECDILKSTKQFGGCMVAVLADGAPQNLARLRCDTLITNGAVSGAFSEHTVVLSEARPEVRYIIKGGKMKMM